MVSLSGELLTKAIGSQGAESAVVFVQVVGDACTFLPLSLSLADTEKSSLFAWFHFR